MSSPQWRHSLPIVSVVIPTYNRSFVLLETIEHVAKQKYAPFEVIVVDQSDKSSSEAIRLLQDTLGPRAKYIHLTSPGLPNARNVGIEAASGEIILFIDDDVIPVADDFILNHARNYFDSQVVAVAGRVIEENVQAHRKPPLRVTRWGTISGNPNGLLRAQVDSMKGCNMSFRRHEAIKAGLFSNEMIGTAQFEDAEFALRLQRSSKGRIDFDPTAALYHRKSIRGGCESRTVVSLQRQVWRFHNMTVTSLRNTHMINPALFFAGRLLAAWKIAVSSFSLSAPAWLALGTIMGIMTYRRGQVLESWRQYIVANL